MTPTDEEIDALWNRLIGSRSNPSVLEIDAGNMLLALKARAEAAEKRVKELEAVMERIANYKGTYVGGTIFMATVARGALEAKP